MNTNFLRQELFQADTDNGNPILTINTDKGPIRVYSPDSSEYRVSADVVQKAHDLGADIIAYSDLWSAVTVEGTEHGKTLGIKIMPFAAFFKMLRKLNVPVK